MKNGINVLLCSLMIVMFACTDKAEPAKFLTSKTFNYPVLKGKEDNPVLRFNCETNSDLGVNLSSVFISLTESTGGNVKSIKVYATGKDSLFNNGTLFGEAVFNSGKMEIRGDASLTPGDNYFWLSIDLNETVDLKAKLSIKLESIQLGDNKYTTPTMPSESSLRLGVAVRKHRDDNVHTYRIPGLVTTNKGTLLAVYDVRREGGRDLQGHMDIGVSRSTNQGHSWEDMRLALDMGEWGGLPEKFNGVSDANILVDRKTGNIFIAGLWMHGVINAEGVWQENLTEESVIWNHQWRTKGSQPGFGVKETSQFLLTKSTDDGQSWEEPVNLTRMCKKEEWWLWAPAPGHGISLDDGTLLMPTQGRDKTGLPFSNITYSKDGGITWTTSNAAYQNTTESMAVQLSDGSVMLNMRDNRNRQEKGEKNGRAVAITKDLGETWTEHESSHGALIECVCMASIHKHHYTDKDGNKKSVLFFSNPNSKYKRHKQTIKASFDEGLTWPEKYWIELDEGRGAGYSCITSIDEETIGILYEGSQAHMTFQQIEVKEILENN